MQRRAGAGVGVPRVASMGSAIRDMDQYIGVLGQYKGGQGQYKALSIELVPESIILVFFPGFGLF